MHHKFPQFKLILGDISKKVILVPRVLVTFVQRRNGQQQDSWTSGSTAHVFEKGTPRLLDFRSYCAYQAVPPGRITLSQRSLLLVPPLDKGNEDSGNEIVRLHLRCAIRYSITRRLRSQIYNLFSLEKTHKWATGDIIQISNLNKQLYDPKDDINFLNSAAGLICMIFEIRFKLSTYDCLKCEICSLFQHLLTSFFFNYIWAFCQNCRWRRQNRKLQIKRQCYKNAKRYSQLIYTAKRGSSSLDTNLVLRAFSPFFQDGVWWRRHLEKKERRPWGRGCSWYQPREDDCLVTMYLSSLFVQRKSGGFNIHV